MKQPTQQYPMMKVFSFEKADQKTHTVMGKSTEATPDKDGEIGNYEATVKAYQKWSAEFQKSTSASGQKTSLGNIRIQHTTKVGGKATAIDYDDANKCIVVTSEPIDDTMWNAIEGGFYTGYSQGGDYAWRRCADCSTDINKSAGNFCPECKKDVYVEYAPVIAEVSYVDNPCHGSAHFELVKSDGSSQLVKFQTRSNPMEQETPLAFDPATLPGLIKAAVAEALAKADAKTKRKAGEDLPASAFAYVGDKDDTSTWKLPIKFSTDEKTKSHIRAALARFNQTQGIPAGEKAGVKAKIEAAAKEHGIEVSDDAEKTANAKELIKKAVMSQLSKRVTADVMEKDMYGVAQFAGLIESLTYVLYQANYERDFEQDGSTLPDELQEDLESLVETFLAMAEEETTELTAATAERIGKVMKSVTATGLDKAYNKAAGIVNKVKKAVEDHHNAMTEAGQAHVEKVHGHMDDLKECMNCDEPGAKKVVKNVPSSKAPDQDTEVDDLADGEPEFKDDLEEGTENIAQEKVAKGKQQTFTKADVEEIVNSAIQSLVKNLTKADAEDEDEQEEEEQQPPPKKKAEKGIGVRSFAQSTGPVVKAIPVSKSDDGQGQPEANRMVKAVVGDVDAATVAKALASGDTSAKLALMKGAKPQANVPSTLHGAVGRLGRSRTS